MRTPPSRPRTATARRAALPSLALLAAAVLLLACSDPLPGVGEASNDPGCSPRESAAENDAADLRRARHLRLILLVGQMEVVIRSSERSLASDDVPLFPLTAEHRALLWTNAMEIDAILMGIEAVLDEMPDGAQEAQELRSRRQPLRLASIAWADWLTRLVERGEQAFDEQPQFFDGPPIRQAHDLFNDLLAELYSLNAQSACPDSPESAADDASAAPAILRMLMLISLMESEVRSICAVTGCPVRSVDQRGVARAPLTPAERAALRHAAARLVILRGLAWELRPENTDQLPQALLADLEAAPVPLDELTTQWFRFAQHAAGGAPDALSRPHITYGILGAQVTVFNIYARHLAWP